MNDIVKEARFYANDVQHIVRGLLERIHELESQLNLSELARLGLLESLGQSRQALDWGEENRVLGFELIQELEQERDAALERVRVLKDAAEYVFNSYAPRDGFLNEIWGSLQGALNEEAPNA